MSIITSKTAMIHNKSVYFKMGLRKMVNQQTKCKDLHQNVVIEVDGKQLDLPPIEGIIILNILSWGAGANPWGVEKDEAFSKPTHYDGLLEVVGVTGVVHMGQIFSGLRTGTRLAQGEHIRISLKTDIPVQVDGEPWIQSPGQIVVLRSALKATMLKKRKRRKVNRRHTEPGLGACDSTGGGGGSSGGGGGTMQQTASPVAEAAPAASTSPVSTGHRNQPEIAGSVQKCDTGLRSEAAIGAAQLSLHTLVALPSDTRGLRHRTDARGPEPRRHRYGARSNCHAKASQFTAAVTDSPAGTPLDFPEGREFTFLKISNFGKESETAHANELASSSSPDAMLEMSPD
ncbi:unnamed protein product [Schistocephalus solidus]|uniref:DAGKa domain-containing protein n=1 Tax=Schistocephalus solidus TaxID=70667 RepID=A0A183SG06_SCHSO|nr:unnamed protein product [Schistocephalus solidus]